MSEITIIRSGETAALDPVASGFAYGFGLFETVKLGRGGLCFWSAHWQRLQQSAAALGLPLVARESAVLEAIRQLVDAESLREGTIKLSLLKTGGGSRLYVYARPGHPSPERVALRLETACPIHEHSLLAGHKTHNYMENCLLLSRARADGYTDLIRVNTAGVLAELTMANLFFIHDGRLCTPALGTGILPGVVRGALVEGRDVREGFFPPEVLAQAEAVFITNSSVGLLPVDHIVGPGLEAALDSRAHAAFPDLHNVVARMEEARSVAL